MGAIRNIEKPNKKYKTRVIVIVISTLPKLEKLKKWEQKLHLDPPIPPSIQLLKIDQNIKVEQIRGKYKNTSIR